MYNWPWTNCLELLCCSFFVAVSSRPALHGRGQSVCKSLLLSAYSWGMFCKRTDTPWVPLPAVSYSASSCCCLVFLQSPLKKDCRVGRGKPQQLPEVASSVQHSNQGWEERAGGSPTWASYSQALDEGKVTPTLEPKHSVFARAYNSISTWRRLTAGSGWVQLAIPSVGGSSDAPDLGGQIKSLPLG